MRRSLVLALLVLSGTGLAQAPVNDDCSGAIPVGLGLTAIDTRMATDGPGQALDPTVCDMGPSGNEQIYQDIWFLFTPPATANYDIEVVNNGNFVFDSRVSIYAQSTCPDDPATVIACDDDSGYSSEAAVYILPLTAGVTHLIRVGSYSLVTIERPAALSISFTAPPPANDVCGGAVPAGLGLTPFDNSLVLVDGLDLDPMVCDIDGSTDEGIYHDLWFRFTAPTTDSYDFHTDNGTFLDTRLAVYDQSSCPDDPQQVIGCSDDVLGLGAQSLVSANLTAGATYLVRVGSDDPANRGSGNLFIGLTPPPPSNDDCENATAIGLGITPFDITHASNGTGQPLDPFICNMGPAGDEQIYHDVWFAFTPASSGWFDIEVKNGANPIFDSKLAVYDQSSCPDDPLQVIACDDDGGFSIQAAVYGVAMNAGTTYLIRAGKYALLSNEYPAQLEISVGTMPPPRPANNRCPDAQALPGFGDYPFDTTNATTNGFPLEGFCDIAAFGGDDIQQDVWFTYTSVTGGCVYISTLGLAGFDTRLAVYGSTACPEDETSVLACSDDENWPASLEAGLDVILTPGQTVLIRLGSWDFTSSGGSGMLRVAPGPVAVLSDMGMQPGAPGCVGGDPFQSLCNGDGGDQLGCTACPCSNDASPGTVGGCLNSSGSSSRLSAGGDSSVSLPAMSTSDLRFEMTGGPALATSVLLSGAAVAPQNMANPCFGLSSGSQAADRDGLRCAVQSVQRHGNRQTDVTGSILNASGASRVWGGPAQPTAGIASQGGFVSGQTRYFQVTHRDDALLVCTRGLNTSQAVEVTFTP